MLSVSVLDELKSIAGWSTPRKVLIFESDDWGSIRMSSTKAFEHLTKHNIDLGPIDSLRFNRFDRLESANDLDGLYEVLSKHADYNGRRPVITALSLVANPDFDGIERAEFNQYTCESLPLSLERYFPGEKVWPLWKEGVSKGLMSPQFHGREHLNVHHWMLALREGNATTLMAFREGIWGYNNDGISFQAAFDFLAEDELSAHAAIIEDGLNRFEALYGYRATFFVPPNGLLSETLHNHTKKLGINYLYSSIRHKVPVGNGKWKTRFNFLGKRNSAGQLFITRNAFFEPSLDGRDWIASCLRDVERAFRWRKPAIISTHRVNFIGSLVESNRKRGLSQLDELLRKVLIRWPDIEFMTTQELGNLMDKQ